MLARKTVRVTCEGHKVSVREWFSLPPCQEGIGRPVPHCADSAPAMLRVGVAWTGSCGVAFFFFFECRHLRRNKLF